MIARLKAARRSGDMKRVEDVLGVLTLFLILFFSLALPGSV